MEEESIYNLIPKEYVQPPRQPLYKSIYSPNIPPTGTTLGLKTTSVPGVGNMAGSEEQLFKAHIPYAPGATFGTRRGQLKPSTQNFMRKGAKTEKISLPSVQGTVRFKDDYKKPPIPKREDKPIYGLVTKKNFVVSNAVEIMLAQPKVKEDPIEWKKKPEYGKVPRYLEDIKEQMAREYNHIKAIQEQEEEEQNGGKFMLSEEEIKILREGLKKRYEAVNKDYQRITHISNMSSIGLRRRKEGYEKELQQIEKDLEKLNKAYIFVDRTQ